MLQRLLIAFSLLLAGCIDVPEGVEVVEDFDLDRYLGTWYEVARTDNSFEKDFRDVTATYSLRDDGSVDVLNKGYDTGKREWRETQGTALFVGDPSRGELKVSFFGPFYSSYNIIGLDREGYRWAMVTGYRKKLFWILARQPEMAPGLLDSLVRKAGEAGFDTSNLVINGVESAKPKERGG